MSLFAPLSMCNSGCRPARGKSIGEEEELSNYVGRKLTEEIAGAPQFAMPAKATADPDENLPQGLSLAAAAALCSEEIEEGTGIIDAFLRETSLGNMETVEKMIQAGVDPNCTSETDETALHVAAYHGRLEMVKLLLAHGAHTEVVDGKGKTPLRRAYDNEDVAEVLLQAGADPNSADMSSGGTTLHRAAEGGYVAVVQLLLRHGAHPNRSNEDGETALHEACIYGQAACVQFLLAGKADPISCDHQGNTPLHCCAYSDDIPSAEIIANLLLEAAPAIQEILNTDGETYHSLYRKRAERIY